MTPYEASRVPWKELVSPLCCISVQFSSVAQSCPTLCDPMDCSTPGLPVHHQLPEFTQIHVHWVDDAIQPSHPLSSPSPGLNLSQHQGIFQGVSSSHWVAKVLEFQLQHQSFQWIFSTLIKLYCTKIFWTCVNWLTFRTDLIYSWHCATNLIDMSLSKLQELVMDPCLVCYSPWGRKELDTIERLDWTDWLTVCLRRKGRKKSPGKVGERMNWENVLEIPEQH